MGGRPADRGGSRAADGTTELARQCVAQFKVQLGDYLLLFLGRGDLLAPAGCQQPTQTSEGKRQRAGFGDRCKAVSECGQISRRQGI